jgi:hypothetical protein
VNSTDVKLKKSFKNSPISVNMIAKPFSFGGDLFPNHDLDV